MSGDTGLELAKLLLPLVLAILGWAGYYLAGYLQAHVKSAKARDLLLRLEHVLLAAVDSAGAVAQGSLAAGDDLDTAKAKVVEEAKSHLGLRGLEEMETVLGLKVGGGEQLVGAMAALRLGAQTSAPAAVPPVPATPLAEAAHA